MFSLSDKNKFLFKYYLLLFCRGFVFLRHYLVILLDNTLTPIEVSFVISIGIIANVLFSMPISILSSKIGNRKVFIISAGFFVFSNILLLYGANFFDFVIYSIASSVFDAVFTSSKESLIYENMKYYNLTNKYAEYRSLSKFFKLIATTIATFIAGDLVYTNPNVLFIVDAIIITLMFLSVYFMKDSKPKYKKLDLKKPVKYLIKHKTLMKCVIHRVIWYSIFMFLIMYRSLFYEELAINDMNINLMISFQVFIVAILQVFITKYLNKKSLFVQYYLFVMISFILLMSFVIYRGISSYIAITLYFILIEALGDLTYSNTLRFIPNNEMSIMLSFINLLVNGAKLVFVNLFALVSSFYTYKTGFVTIGFIFFVSMLVICYLVLIDTHMKNVDCRIHTDNK